MTARQEFPSKTSAETKLLTFDFSSDLGAGETLSSAVASCVVWSGTDSAPSSMISGALAISGGLITQLFTGGVAGVIYIISMLATTSLGQVIPKTGYLAVVAPQPG